MLVVHMHPKGLSCGTRKLFTIFTIVGFYLQMYSLDVPIQISCQKGLVVAQLALEPGFDLKMHHLSMSI